MANNPAPKEDKAKFIKIGLVVVVLAVIGWQVVGMLGSGSSSSSVPQQTVIPNPDIPKTASLVKPKKQEEPKVLSEREKQLIRLQQQTEAKLIAAQNELQIITVEKEIAKAKEDISKAKFAMITNQKEIISLLAPKPVPETKVKSDIAKDGQIQAAAQLAAQRGKIKYGVVSITKLQGKWHAVISAKSKLYRVSEGDVLTPTRETIMKIDPTGLILESNGRQRKISMMPII